MQSLLRQPFQSNLLSNSNSPGTVAAAEIQPMVVEEVLGLLRTEHAGYETKRMKCELRHDVLPRMQGETVFRPLCMISRRGAMNCCAWFVETRSFSVLLLFLGWLQERASSQITSGITSRQVQSWKESHWASRTCLAAFGSIKYLFGQKMYTHQC